MCFLEHLPDYCVFQAFAWLDESGKCRKVFWRPVGISPQQAGIAVSHQHNDGRVYAGKRLPGTFLVAANELMSGRQKPVRVPARPTESMAVLPVVQRLGVGQYSGVFGIHVNRRPAQVDELRFGMQNQNIFALTVVNGYGKEIAFSIGAQKRRSLYGVQLIEFARLQIDCDLPFLCRGEQTSAAPEWKEAGCLGVLRRLDPFRIVTVFDQPVEAYGCETVTAGARYPVNAEIRSGNLQTLNGKRRPAATGGGCVRVANHELRALQALRVVDLGSHQVLKTQGIYQQGHAIIVNGNIIFSPLFIEGKAVLKARATATADVDAQFEVRITFLQDQFLYFAGRRVGEHNAWYYAGAG